MRVFKRGWWWSESSGSLANEVEALAEKNDELQEKLVELEMQYSGLSKESYKRLKDMEFWKALAIKYRDERCTECTRCNK